jgi:deoxyribonuclease-4
MVMTSSSFRFGTVGSPKSTPAKPGGSVGAVNQIAFLQLDALELGWVQAVRVSPETCSVIKEAAVEMNVAISVHAPYFINLNADEEEWPKSRKRLMDAAYYGYLAGATDIIFHPGSYFGRSPAEVLEIALKRLAGCVDELRAQNTIVNLRPETMGKSAMLGSLEDTLAMSQIGKVFPCLDFAHLHARPGDGSVNSYDEWSKILDQYAAKLGKESLKSLHIHLSGIEYGPKGEKNHLPVQESDLDIKGLFTALAKHQCGGRIMCESPILEEDAVYLKTTWLEISGQN